MDNGNILAKGGCERIGAGGSITHKVLGKPDYKAEIDYQAMTPLLKRSLLY